MNKQIDLARMADETEIAFITASSSIKSVDDEEKAKKLLYVYLNVLKLKRLRDD